jgi:hypothetical protein
MTEINSEGYLQQAPEIPEAPKLAEAERARLGEKLAAFYKDLLDTPIPERFTRLLAELEQTAKEREC